MKPPFTIVTYNCVSQAYPFIESISSMLEFCDVNVVDCGSTDGTLYKLYELAKSVAQPGELTNEFIQDVEACGPETSTCPRIRKIDTKRLKVQCIDDAQLGC